MKNLVYIMLLLTANTVLAQRRESGIYITSQDFMDGKLSYAFNCDSSNGKIKTHPIFGNQYIDIIKNGEKLRLLKDSIFGYRRCNADTRLYHPENEEYQIMENLSVVIYVSDVPVKSSTGRTVDMVPAYFFSTSLSGNIYPLTVLDLKRAFPENLKFHDLLDMTFGDGVPLSGYDYNNKIYTVNYLIYLSRTGK
jgi:hypothetical protein